VLPAELSLGGGGGGGGGARKKAPRRSGGGSGGAAVSGDALTAPMQGTIVKIAVEDGQTVEQGQTVVVLEAMKMEQPINAHKAGVVSGLTAEIGATVTSGTVLAEIKDADA
jgi:acetyl-CoA/propionyl-CoA carboxylase biotin carboxyl carrier protein